MKDSGSSSGCRFSCLASLVELLGGLDYWPGGQPFHAIEKRQKQVGLLSGKSACAETWSIRGAREDCAKRLSGVEWFYPEPQRLSSLVALFLKGDETYQKERGRGTPDVIKNQNRAVWPGSGRVGCHRVGDDMADSTTKLDFQLLAYLDRVREHRSAAPGADVRSTGAQHRSAAKSTLSTAHISPQIQYYQGASLFKASKGGECDQVGGGVRGKIKGFSYGSRRRLMLTIAKVRRDAALPMFITLTYPDEFPDPAESKIHLDNFCKRLRRTFPDVGMIWKLEPQQRGAPHFHCLAWGVDLAKLMNFVPQAWFEIAGGGDQKHLAWHKGLCGHGNKHCVQQVKSFKGVWFYAAKYLGKTFEVAGWDKKWTGRYWGVIARENIPFGELRELVVTRQFAIQVMRYQRRFAKPRKVHGRKIRKSPTGGRSLTIFCDASQWAERLYPLNE